MARRQIFISGLFFLLVCSCIRSNGQSSPEEEQMLRNARAYISARNFKQAIIIYKQALLISPDKYVLFKELARAQYLDGEVKDAEKTLESIIAQPEADAECYQLMAASQRAMKGNKQARTTAEKGLQRFSHSGALYHELGKAYLADNKKNIALEEWLLGIANEPTFAENYYDASIAYLETDNVFPGLLYGEIYLNLLQDTSGSLVFRKKLLVGYKALFDNLVKGKTPAYRKKTEQLPVKGFEDAAYKVLASLSPVVSDGITTENLTMFRTRFLMEWFTQDRSKYDFYLFHYHDELVRTGHFDIYNQWLFGNAENEQEYTAWNKFHAGDMDRFFTWRKEHPFSLIYK